MDELLWRQHVSISVFLRVLESLLRNNKFHICLICYSLCQASWLLDGKAARGYLPYGVILLPRVFAKDPNKRGRTHEWFRLLWYVDYLYIYELSGDVSIDDS